MALVNTYNYTRERKETKLKTNLIGSLAMAAAVFAAGASLTATAAGTPPVNTSSAEMQGVAKQKVVFQVSDADPKKWNLTFNNVKNIQHDLGKGNTDIEVVAYGPGIGMLKLDSEVGARVAEALGTGVRVVACENTMTNTKLTKADMLPNIGYVKAGVVELMEKQRQGYAYIRP